MRPRGHFRMKAEQLQGVAGGSWYRSADSVRGVRGVVYYMQSRLTEMERRSVERYGNTRIMPLKVGGLHRSDVIFLGERCFTEGEKLQQEIVWN